MDIIVEFNEAAFQHKICKEDILHALKTKICDVSIEELPEKYAVIGFDRKWNTLEVFYNPIDDNHINVFHAMDVRNSTIKKIGL